jgi:hypothetical protein
MGSPYSQHGRNTMHEPTVNELRVSLMAALHSGDRERLSAAFERLALLDGYRIAQRAREYSNR